MMKMVNGPLLEMQKVSKQFGKEKIVKELSMQVPANCIYGLLGPNGAGKSTTLKMLTGIIAPSSGSIWFDGHRWSRQDLKQIGALIESPPIYGNLTAFENLKVRSLLLGLPDTRIQEVLDMVNLSTTGRKTARNFSMGMKQRLGIAIALLNRPRLLILDEPTNGLDPVGIHELRELIRSFPRQGVTVILSSHLLSEVEQTADRIGIINHGELLYEGEIQSGQNLEQLFMDVASTPDRRKGGYR
ncbi:lantibiotic protection ABC transporter ATP-binding protein [Paenibacillus lactis]|uniref:lantibiotic protection ABC transporter ATP-binding protein n=1 Tax=Paenibacillus lactis TaxID=228574 RepID=UPI00368BAF78